VNRPRNCRARPLERSESSAAVLTRAFSIVMDELAKPLLNREAVLVSKKE
jgi:hypothetical protein